MNIQINWLDIAPSPALEDEIQKRFEKLQQFCDEITAAYISIDQIHRSHGRTHSYNVTLELHVPDTEIVVSHHPGGEATLHDLYLLLHRTFDTARRQLQDYVRIRQGKIKRHVPQLTRSRTRAYPPDTNRVEQHQKNLGHIDERSSD